MTDKCPECGNTDLRPFKGKDICIKCNWNAIPDECDSCNQKNLFTHPCGCLQCRSCPRVNGRFCKSDHRFKEVKKTFIKEGTFILNNHKDIVYTDGKNKSAV